MQFHLQIERKHGESQWRVRVTSPQKPKIVLFSRPLPDQRTATLWLHRARQEISLRMAEDAADFTF